MKLKRINQYIISGILLMIFILFSSLMEEKVKLRYMQKSTISLDLDAANNVNYKDTLLNDLLYLVKSKEHIPVYYFRKIITEVCVDKQCRLLAIKIFWNITGRYLGFELPEGEFLSKYDHEPFISGEYERLNELLADPTLPLGDIPFEKLIELPKPDGASIDGISGATTEDLAKIVVKGAAYTTYTLWNIVNGPTVEIVAHLTENQLSPDLIEFILKSPDISDRFWALERIDQKTVLTPNLISTLLDMISEDNFSLAYNTVDAISPTHLDSDSLQLDLFLKYDNVNHSIQKVIIDKLMEAPYLHPGIVTISRGFLDQLNGKQLEDMLLLYSKHSIDDLETCTTVSKILQDENRFISQQAYKFLQTKEIEDKEIISLLDNYKLVE